MRTCILVCIGVFVLVAAHGCIQAKAPESIVIGGGAPPERVDSSRTPQTRSHEEARAELEKAYRQIQYLEEENQRLRRKYENAKAEREEYERRYEQLKDRYED
ncbi:MAG: hypothetical protein JXB13_21175 [Phycisphaerae bacterium]|nr:hypothetical protein [Phycisphaerae bacterium]